MHRALETLGIRPGQKVSIDILLSETFNGNLYGMGEDQMVKVKALRDILADYEASHKTPGRKVNNSRDAASHLFDTLKGLGHEEVWVLYLNSGNAVIGKEQIYKGSLSESTFSCRDVIARFQVVKLLYRQRLTAREAFTEMETMIAFKDLMVGETTDFQIIIDKTGFY